MEIKSLFKSLFDKRERINSAEEFEEFLKAGRTDFSRTNLSDLDLSGIDFKKYHEESGPLKFYRALLKGTNLSSAYLDHSDFSHSDFVHVKDQTELNTLMSKIITEVYGVSYSPKIVYAGSEEEFRKNLEEHFRKPGEKMPANKALMGGYYSDTLKECIISPSIFDSLLTVNEEGDVNKLGQFEYIINLVTLGLTDFLRGGNRSIPVCLKSSAEIANFFYEHLSPLEEYIVSMSARQVTIDYATQIVGNQDISDLLDDFVKENWTSSPLTSEAKERMRKTFSNVGKTDEEISRYFIANLTSKEGLNKILREYLKNLPERPYG